MFERYTEKARRVIFFARYEASQFGSHTIESQHLLLGLLREDKGIGQRYLGTTSSESIRKQIEARVPPSKEKLSTALDLPLSQECKHALHYAAEEARRLKSEHIGTEHLLLGLLRDAKSVAGTVLHERGLNLAAVRETLATGAETPLEKLQNTLAARLRAQEPGITVSVAPRVGSHSPSLAVFAAEQIPLLCVEVLSPDDRFSDLTGRIAGYLAVGVAHVWLLDPASKRAYAATAETGLREVKTGVLKTANPGLQLRLDEIFV